MQFTVELALPNHIDEINCIEIACALQYSEQVLPEPLRSSHLSFSTLLRGIDEERLFVVLSQKGNVQGYVFLEIKEDAIHLAQIDVAPCYQRHGIGRLLLQHAILWGKKLQFSSIWLTTFNNIPCNRPFYEKNGFLVREEILQPEWIKKILQYEEKFHLRDRVAMVYFLRG